MFRWQKYNILEFEECGISVASREDAVQFFSRAMKTCMLLSANSSTPAVVFFTNVFHAAVGFASVEAKSRMLLEDRDFVNRFDEIVHALSHCAQYALAQYEYNKSAATFEAAVSEMIDAQEGKK
jgi:hypothetical protein